MTFTSAEIGAWVGGFMWPFMRIGALFLALPVFGTRLVPARVRVLLAVALTLAVMPASGEMPAFDVLSPQGLLVSLQQVLIGVAMGFSIQLVFSALVMAGEQIAMSMGLGFASMVDPQNGVNVPVVSQFLVTLATLLYFAIGGHAAVVTLLADSFTLLPVAPIGLSRDAFWLLASWGSQMFIGALLVALPVVASLLVVYLALGVMTRAAPQMNIFSVGFPVTMMAGFVALLLTLRLFLPRFEELLASGLALARGLLGG